MTTLFHIWLSNKNNKGSVHAVQGALRMQPDMAAVREWLPHQYRKALDRAGAFWWDKHDERVPGYITLRDRRGRYLATLRAQQYEFKPGE